MTRGRSRAVWVLVAVLGLAAVTLHWAGVRPLVADDRAVEWPWLAAVTVGFLAAELGVVHLRLGREAYAFSMMEIPLVVGCYFVRPDLLVACRLAGALLAFAWRRKDLQKALFNLALFALETTGAVLIWNTVLSGHDPLGPWGWLATVTAVAFTSVLSSTLVSVVITVATGELPRSVSEVLSLGQVGDLANACFALVAVYVLAAEWRAVWLLAVALGVMYVAYRSYEGARSRSESLEKLNRFTQVVGREVDVDAVVRRVLVEVRTALDVEQTLLRVSRPLEVDEDWCYDGEVVARGRRPLVDRLADHAEGGTVLVQRNPRTAGLAELLTDEGLRDCLMVPLRSVGQVAGSLVVTNRLGDVAPFTAADVNQLQALANHAAVALENAVRAETIIRQADEREHEAMHDDLTGLANRRLFARVAGERLTGGPVAMVLLDLDRFKEVNDTLGHEVGDRLLRVVAERIAESAPGAATVARLGGDEFAVLLPGAGVDDGRVVADAVREVLTRPLTLGGFAVAVDASVGVAVGAVGDDAVGLLRRADLAMSSAKHLRSGVEVYRAEMDQLDSTRLGLLADLRDAVAGDELEVAYQPKIDVGSGRVVGVEALARWNHPRLGAVRPDEFIPLAEHSTLITPLTMLVLRKALVEAERWRAASADFSVAVNISPRSLLDPCFVDEVARALARVELPASALVLEITETSLMADPERAITALLRLRALGVRLSVDDLGTGYSSLAYLQRLPVDEIKIDRSFLFRFGEPSAQAVVETIVDLGHRLGKQVVAEGVEASEWLEALKAIGCDCAQGFWIARPLPAVEVTRFIEGRQPRAAGPLRVVQ